MVKTFKYRKPVMILILILLVFSAKSAPHSIFAEELVNIAGCSIVTESCSVNKEPRDCELVCTEDDCIIRIGVILPNSTSYIVNLDAVSFIQIYKSG